MSKENGDQLMLKRSFGMREAVTITVGTVIGVGLFTTGAQIVGLMGSAVVLATFIAMVISVYPARLYIMHAETPSAEEGARMDREYKLWKRIVAAACVIAVLLYVIPLIG